jgi:sulfate transport system permease protein
MSGTDTSITSAFAVSSILVIIAVAVLVARNIFEYRSKKNQQTEE